MAKYMNSKLLGSVFITISLLLTPLMLHGSDDTIRTVTPNASPEAVALLEYIYSIYEARTIQCLLLLQQLQQTLTRM